MAWYVLRMHVVRLRYGHGLQRRFNLPDPEREAALRALAKQLVKARTDAERAVNTLETACTADVRTFGQIQQIVAEWVAAAEKQPKPRRATRNAPAPLTFERVAREWVDGTMSRNFPDQVPVIFQETNRQRLEKHVFPLLGATPIAEVKRADCDAVMRALPAKLSRSTRRQYAGLIQRVLNLAELAGYIPRSPLPRGWLPKPNAKKRFPILYPSEDRQLLACTAIPLAFRVLYGYLHREGPRLSEALRLTWDEVDLEHGTVSISVNKTDHARWWRLSDGVAPALKRWRETRGATSPDASALVFTGILDPGHLSETLREHMALAGLTRADLFSKGENKGAFGPHSFRRSFVTRCLALGREADYVRQRTGHKSEELLRYRQAANGLAELDLGEVLRLDLAIPELSESKGESELENACEDGGTGRRARFRF